MKKRLYIIIGLYLLYSVIVYNYIKSHPWNNSSRYVIHHEKIVDTIGTILWFEKWKAKWIALPPPFILLRRENHTMNETWIRHEQTHHLQQLESFYLFSLISRCEYQYNRYINKKTHIQSYLLKATEQEAYLNQDNPDYNKTRPFRNTRKYFFHKTNFTLQNYQVTILWTWNNS